MANIYYNSLTSPENMVTFTDVPNILKIEEYISGTKAQFTFTFSGNLKSQVTADTQFYVTFLGETVSNVMNASDAKNKRFFISNSNTGTAMSFARALRNCSSISADFNIIHNNNSVTLIAKTIGQKWSNIANFLQRNIPTEYLSTSGTDGSTYSQFFGGKIDVDVYSGSSVNDSGYVTTLEKNFYGNECAFNMSPVLATMSDFGYTTPYQLSLSLITSDGEWASLGTVSGATTVGYLANESEKYLYATNVQPLINNKRGVNGSILYTYFNEIPYSVLCGSNTGGWTVTLSCKDSAFNEIYQTSTTNRKPSSNLIVDSNVVIPQATFANTYYVDVTVGNKTVRFNVIKPLKATEYGQRIQWRNEYGGISFFDFTSARSETDNVDIETYEKNIFDYYETNEFEKKKIYKNDYKKSVKLTSHLMEEDGKWIFNSLMRSKRVWTTVNGEKFYIIPKTIEVAEDQNYNNIYTATLTYEYSDIA